ncbi:hypothetical protein J0X14_14175 [Muricauda sp. CAU 1633]|uniref:hypothetical protein n=1 Tax=Allomuricauda sp. CAU 1633 TaxID=2816036 RepID=UPI001A905856|nr:hypothetical protein [Muricauda sp. CAU 1633]MBO0323451.1 hypothetical protein [Muricauda sp. CAU 1633]
MRYLLFFVPFICFSQFYTSSGERLQVYGSSGRVSSSSISYTVPPSGPTPGAARTAIPDYTGLTIVDVAATYGWSAGDMTSAINSAIAANDSPGTPVVLKFDTDNGSTWEIDSPINVSDVSDLYFQFDSGLTLQQGDGEWGAGSPDDLFRFDDADNLRFYGYGATLHMEKTDFTSGEHAHVFIADNGNDVELWGLTLEDSGGDGIYVNEWTNFKLMDLVSDNNSRQALSIISGANGEVNGCSLQGTQPNGVGAAANGPWDGLDFEPNPTSSTFDNILVKNIDMIDNDAAFLDFAWGNYDGDGNALDITIEDCYASLNHQNPWTTGTGEIRFTCASDMTGTVDFTRVFIDGSTYPGIYSIMEADGPSFTYEDVVLYDTNSTATTASIRFRRIGAPCSDENTLGGFFFDNLTIYNNVDDDIIDVGDLGGGDVFKNVTGNIKGITDYTSNTISYKDSYDSGNNVNVTLSLDMDSSPPSTTLSIEATTAIGAEDTQNDIVFTVTRTSSEVDYALPFRVAYSGTADNRDDYHGLPSGFVIPAGASTFEITVVPRNDEWTNPSSEGDETVIITLQTMTDAYTIGTASDTATIKETL